MCFGSQPQAPEIRYVGPSQEDINANNAALEKYRAESLTQQKSFAEALQKQIDQANAQAAEQRKRLEDEKATAAKDLEAQRSGAAAEMAAQQKAAYAVTTTMTEPVNAQVTQAPKPKDKTKGTLKIAPGATAMTPGAGLNIGV